MKTIRSLAPLAVFLVVVGAAIGWMLSRDIVLGKWVLAAVMLGHGWVHAMFLAKQPAAPDPGKPEWPFDMARSWLVTRSRLAPGAVRGVGMALIAVTAVGFLLAALATVGLLVPADWWPALVLVSAAASALMLGLFFNAQLVLGLAIDAVLIWVVVASVWTPAA